MSARRHHSDIFVAAFILFGMLGWVGGLVYETFEMRGASELGMWFGAALLGAMIARYVLADLDISETAIAAAVTIAIVLGILYARAHRAMRAEMLIPIATGELGALLGAWAVKPRAKPAQVVLTFAAGTAGFGGSVVGVGIVIVGFGDPFAMLVVAVPLGSLGGGTLITMFTAATWQHTAAGQALIYASLGWAFNDSYPISGAVIGAIGGAMLGAISGVLGKRLRRPPRSPDDLPPARIV